MLQCDNPQALSPDIGKVKATLLTDVNWKIKDHGKKMNSAHVLVLYTLPPYVRKFVKANRDDRCVSTE